MMGIISSCTLLALVAIVPVFAIPGYTDVISSNVTPSKGGEVNNYRVTTAGNIPSAPDYFTGDENDVFAYVWIAAVDCSEYEDSNCGGNHDRAILAILDADSVQGNDNPNWQVVAGTFSIHPQAYCDGNQAVTLDVQNQAQLESSATITIKGHKMTLTLDADSTPVTPDNFTNAESVALSVSPYDNVMCVGSLTE